MKCLVVFHGQGTHWASPFLKPGFRHVFVVLSVGAYWIMVDPRNGLPIFDVVAGTDYDLESFYRGEGYRVVVVDRPDDMPEPLWPLAWSNCVGVVKAILGNRSLALTPYQLYRSIAC